MYNICFCLIVLFKTLGLLEFLFTARSC